MKGILGVTMSRSSSSDFRGHTRSSIIDSAYTMVLGGSCVKAPSLVRQRMGLQLPRRRPRQGHRREALIAAAIDPLRHPC